MYFFFIFWQMRLLWLALQSDSLLYYFEEERSQLSPDSSKCCCKKESVHFSNFNLFTLAAGTFWNFYFLISFYLWLSRPLQLFLYSEILQSKAFIGSSKTFKTRGDKSFRAVPPQVVEWFPSICVQSYWFF